MIREEAINRLQDAKDGYKEYLTDDAIDLAIKALEQEPKISHWIVNKEKTFARCSNCKFLLKNKDEIKFFGTFIQGYNYCPYCGAKMAESEGEII